MPVENTADRVAIAEFAIGQLNNQLQKGILTSRASEPANHFLPLFGSCQRLRLQEIMNVRQRQTTKGTVVTTIDVRLQQGNMVNQKEIITVQVESSITEKRSSFDMRSGKVSENFIFIHHMFACRNQYSRLYIFQHVYT